MKNIVAFDFKRSLNNVSLSDFAAIIQARLSGNPKFDALKPHYDPHLKNAIDQYVLAVQEASDGGRSKMALRNQAKQALLEVLDNIAAHLNLLAKGDEAMVLEAGFSIANVGKRSEAQIEPVTGIQAISLAEGQLRIRFNRVPNARMYALEWQRPGEDTWHNGIYPTPRPFVVEGLPRRTDLFIRIIAHGSRHRKSAPSLPVPVFVQ